MSKDLIEVIEELLQTDVTIDEAKDNAVNSKNLTSDGKKKDEKTVKPAPKTGDNPEVGVGKSMQGNVDVLDAGGDEDVGGKKGDNPSDASDNSGEIGLKKSMDGDKSTKVLDSGADKDAGPDKRNKTAGSNKTTSGFPSDASSEVEADKGPHDQAKDKFQGSFAEDTELTEEEQALVNEMSDEEIEEMTEERVEELFGKKKMGIHPNRDSWNKRRDALNKQHGQGKYRKEESEEDLEEAGAPDVKAAKSMTLSKASGVANDSQRPPEEKGDNAPETQSDNNPDKGPHDQSVDEIETPTKASGGSTSTEDGKGSAPATGEKLKKVSEESDDEKEEMDEAKKKEEDVTIKTKDGEEISVGSDDKSSNDSKDDEAGTEKGGDKIAPATDKTDDGEGMDPVGKRDADVDNDGDEDESDEYLANRRDAIKKADDKDVKEEADEEKSDEEDLDEDFKEKAAVIFETAVNEKVSTLREELEDEYTNKLNEELEVINEKVNEYVDYAVQEWLKENQLEIKYSLRTEIAENFIGQLKGLFENNFIDIPEEEVSVVDELTEAVESYKEQLEEKETALDEANQELLDLKRKEIFEDVAGELTETQKIRLEKLSESVEATDIEEFRYKVEQLKESYFDPSSEQPLIESFGEEVVGGVGHLHEENEQIDPMARYTQFLSKTVLK